MRSVETNRRHSARRIVICASCAAAALLAGLAPDRAAAGRYEVIQCDRANREFADARFDRVNGGDYGFLQRCQEDEDGNALQIRPITGSPEGRFGRISWSAPDETRIVAVRVEARMRNDAGHQARLSFLDDRGEEAGRIATGGGDASGFETFDRSVADGGRHAFAASLQCIDRDGCRQSDQAKNWIRSVGLTLEDRRPPTVTASGTLSEPGWKRGTGTLGADAADQGSGVRRFELSVNGTSVAPSRTVPCSLIAGSARASRLRPCPAASSVSAGADTSSAPFSEGSNDLRVCASDLGSGAEPTCVTDTVQVDNVAPEAAFERPSVQDPELIRAIVSDEHSGVAGGAISYRPEGGGDWRALQTRSEGGELRARVDSLSEPAGRYAFRVVAVDRAGNIAIATRRRGGGEMLLEFPLRPRTTLRASIGGERRASASYGARPKLEATLRAPGGPVAGESVEVVERFDDGSSLVPRGRTVRTDSHGRIRIRLEPGPSRVVRIAYAGSRRWGPAAEKSVRLTVRARAGIGSVAPSFEAGHRIAFRGSVGVRGADVGRGKLVELQVRGGGVPSFRTVGHAFRTDERGNWQFRYRFGRFYERPTKYRFRLKVSRERWFPYRTPAFSPVRRVTVKPR